MKSKSRRFNINYQKQVINGRWDDQFDTPIEQNAFYAAWENKIFLPSYVLDGWTFNDLRPMILNIPSISYVLGHEMFHGFDSQGHKYDHKGLCSTVTSLSSFAGILLDKDKKGYKGITNLNVEY